VGVPRRADLGAHGGPAAGESLIPGRPVAGARHGGVGPRGCGLGAWLERRVAEGKGATCRAGRRPWRAVVAPRLVAAGGREEARSRWGGGDQARAGDGHGGAHMRRKPSRSSCVARDGGRRSCLPLCGTQSSSSILPHAIAGRAGTLRVLQYPVFRRTDAFTAHRPR
jgi:hypothetical protein